MATVHNSRLHWPAFPCMKVVSTPAVARNARFDSTSRGCLPSGRLPVMLSELQVTATALDRPSMFYAAA